MISYIALKHLHITCAVLSISLFLLRGMLMLRQSPALQQRWLRITPHIVDTALLASAVTMVVWSQQYPFVQSWLTAKVIALIVYIGLGTIALKRGKTRATRLHAFLAALAVFAYIIAVALSKQPFILG
ncbi:SirB2 family protein [Herminiimonas sp. NPDC097707]|uniref:SirB2 family protein n=1 Tax=Herminiimonas sp. NPDC097707 TaxID=3364007 RepID=UPI00383A4547